MFWLALAVLAVAVAALLVRPLLVKPAAVVDRAEYDLAVYKDQLAEIDQDGERGLLSPDQAEAARLEVKRRMLVAAEGRETAAPTSASGRRALAAVVALLVPAGAVLTYLELGNPGARDLPYAAREAERQPAAANVDGEMQEAVQRLAERLRDNPDDVRGWRILARSYVAMGRYGDAAEAYRRIIAIPGEADADTYSGLGEALIFAGDGGIGAEALDAFEQALAADPQDARARFYKGEAALQAGRPQEAVDEWRALLATAPADAPWTDSVRERVRAVTDQFNLAAAPEDDSRPTPSQVQDLDRQTDGLIEAMVESLEQRLQENPDDGAGWARLGRSYLVMGRVDDAREAYARAVDLRPDDVDARLGHAEALLAQAPEGAPLPEAFVAEMQAVHDRAPDNAQALYFLGLAAAESGDTATALGHWQRLLDQLPDDSPRRAELQQQIDSLGG